VFYLRDGLVDAVLSVNDPSANEAGGALIESRRRFDAAALADPAVDLTQLASVPALPEYYTPGKSQTGRRAPARSTLGEVDDHE
jgi:hypothetical protein